MREDENIVEILRRVESPYRRWVIWIGHLAVMLVVSVLMHVLIRLLVPPATFGQASADAIGFQVVWFILLMLHLSAIIMLNQRDGAVLNTLKEMGYQIPHEVKAKHDSDINETDVYAQRLTDDGELIYDDDGEEARLIYNSQ